MAFKGDLTNISLFDVFQTLSQNKQSGVLVLTRNSHTKKVHISPEGVRIFFTRSFRALRLGEIFVRRGRITPQDVEILLLEQKKQYRPIGELLVESGKVSEEEVAEVLRYHAEDEIFEVFGWDSGSFSFYDGQEAGDTSTPLSDILMDPAGLCLEAARRLDELERLREAIPTNDDYYIASGPPPGAEVGDAAARMYDALVEPNSIDELRDLVGLSLHDTLHAVQALLDRDLIRPLTVDELLGAADAAHEGGDLDRAARLLEKAHAHAPDDRGILERCVDVLGRLAQPRPLAGYLAALGQVCLAAGEIEEAIEHLEEAVRSDATHVGAMEALRDAYAQQGDAERVGEVSLRLARAQADAGLLHEALETCREGIEAAPQALPLRFFYAQSLARANRVDEAREEMYAVIHATEGSREAHTDRAYELLSNCYRMLLKIDPGDAHAEQGLREVDRRRMLVMRRKKFLVRGGAAAALLTILVGVGLVTGGPSAESLAAEIRKAQQRKNPERVLELVEELVDAHPDSDEAKWAMELRATLETELSTTTAARRDRENALRDRLNSEMEEVRAALADEQYDEAMAPVNRFLSTLGKPEMASLRKTMAPQVEWLLGEFLDRVRDRYEEDRKQVAACEVQLRQFEGKVADLAELEAKLASVKQRGWERMAPVLMQNLGAVAESPHAGKAAEAARTMAERMAGVQAAFANLDGLFYAVRRERFRAEILDLHEKASTEGQNLLTACDFDRARRMFEAIYSKYEQIIEQEPREHYRDLIQWLDLRTIPAQARAQIDRIENVTKTLAEVDALRKQDRTAAAYRLMRDLVSTNRLIQFEHKYKLPYQVLSLPAGADVVVNGVAAGRTPCEIGLEIGHQPVVVRLRRKGFRDAESRLVPTDPELDGRLQVPLAKEVVWERELNGGGVEANPTIAEAGPGREPAVLLATTNASLLAVALDDGERLWEAETGLLQRIRARPVVAGPSAYLITLDGHLHEIRLRDGKIVNRLDLGARVEQDPVVVDDVLVVATRRPSLVALRSSSILWEQPLAESPSTQVVSARGLLFVGTTKGAILIHDARTGAPKGECRVRSGTSFFGGLTMHGHLVVAGAEDGKLYAFDSRSGKEAWAYATGGPLAAPATSDGKRLYLPARDGYVHILSTEGDCVARLDMGYTVKARPALVNGFLYILGSNRARAFDTTRDGLWWDRAFDGEFPTHIVAGGQRLVAITDKPWVYAFPADIR
jgi:outer membrane protein assembly factor BamB/tetratricopeptide (TPR) repeat protein